MPKFKSWLSFSAEGKCCKMLTTSRSEIILSPWTFSTYCQNAALKVLPPVPIKSIQPSFRTGNLSQRQCLYHSTWSTLWLPYLHWLLSEAACSYMTAEQGPVVSWWGGRLRGGRPSDSHQPQSMGWEVGGIIKASNWIRNCSRQFTKHFN